MYTSTPHKCAPRGRMSDGAASDAEVDVDTLCSFVHSALSASDLSAAGHLSCVRKLGRLRDAALVGTQPGQTAQLLLLCGGTAACRRASLTEDSNLMTTAALVFIVLCVLDAHREKDRAGAEDVLAHANSLSLWTVLEAGDGTTDYGALSQAALAVGVQKLSEGSVADMTNTCVDFFRFASASMAASQLVSDDDFLSLSVTNLTRSLDDNDEVVATLLGAAESEAGQSVLRDIMLSFLLPRSLVGTRKSLLLTRAAAYQATLAFPDDVQRAHETAMAGAQWTWENADDDLRRGCALLAGLACLTTTKGEDPIRKGSAFAGLVNLPFLETEPPPHRTLRISLVPSTGAWVLFSIGHKGAPIVKSSARHFEGLKLAVVGLAESLRR